MAESSPQDSGDRTRYTVMDEWDDSLLDDYALSSPPHTLPRPSVSPRPQVPPRPPRTSNLLTPPPRVPPRPPARRERLPDRYDGKTPWLDYWAHFQSMMDLNRWSSAEATQHLAGSLRDGACRVLYPRPLNRDGTERQFTLHELVDRLNRKYGPDGLAENYLALLKARRQQRGETLQELADDIEKLSLQAYPEAPISFRERLMITHFQDSIVHADIRAAVHRAHPATLTAAVAAALDQEGWQKVELGRSAPVRAVNANTRYVTKEDLQEVVASLKDFVLATGQQKQREKTTKAPKCYRCGVPGHRWRQCSAPGVDPRVDLNMTRSHPGSSHRLMGPGPRYAPPLQIQNPSLPPPPLQYQNPSLPPPPPQNQNPALPPPQFH